MLLTWLCLLTVGIKLSSLSSPYVCSFKVSSVFVSEKSVFLKLVNLSKIPAMIFQLKDEKEEAKGLLDLNSQRVSTHSSPRYRYNYIFMHKLPESIYCRDKWR